MPDEQTKSLPAPWDRIFGLGSRIFVWGLLFAVLYILRPFFLLVFLTFVFAYILEHGVQGLGHRIKRRTVRVVLVAAVFLGTLVVTGVGLAPHFRDQASKLANNYNAYLAKIDEALDDARETQWVRTLIPPNIKARDAVNGLLGLVQEDEEPATGAPAAPEIVSDEEPDLLAHLSTYEGGLNMLREDTDLEWRELSDFYRGRGESPPSQLIDRLAVTLAASETLSLDGEVMDEPWLRKRWELERARGAMPPHETSRNIAQTFERLKNVAGPVLGIGSAFLLSLLFSFLIVLDLPKLSRAVAGLAGTKLGFIYDEVAENIHDFGKMLGRALEAQLLIALCNTALTAIGLYFLDLTENMIFFATIVFFCSFIPVAGVFISSTPIALEALSQSGVQLMLLTIVMILIIHFVEAYFLNPRIFGHHLHMNAVLVLIVLTIAGKLFGVWGLILGLPVVNYFFGHAIRRRDGPNRVAKTAA